MRVENLAEDQSILANCIKTFDDLKSKAKWSLKNKVLTMVLVKLQETNNAVYVSCYFNKIGKLSAYFPDTLLHQTQIGMQPLL